MFINRMIVSVVKVMPRKMIFLFAKNYIAGERLQDAVNEVKKLNSRGIMATMDVLGESVANKDESLLAKTECIAVLNAIKENNLNSNLSIKPTQMGLLLDEEFCYQQVRDLVEKARQYNNFVRIDMEDSSCTDKTINLYLRLRKDYDNVGIVLQSYLRRTYDDVVRLNAEGANYRLCKGIYIEPEKIAFQGKQEVRDSFMRSLKRMLDDGNYVGIATHDSLLYNAASEYIAKNNIPREAYEFQMLLGVREDLRDKIAADGHRLRIYVPFGKDWYKYSIRRFNENPNVAGSVLKNMLRIN
ncbi:MAG: proline dehydrogenase family protein [Ignavibacteriaceae bacterium]|nr:proline dehydrogenase family protein [Ignavibacteriaceae bacterium]NUM70084.1 proline dehydrogenase family protein [Ignavibacteriaceae bacterium]